MTVRLLLHIGTEKTGTTTIQRFCRQQSSALSRAGILYPRTLGKPGHKLLTGISLPYAARKDICPAIDVAQAAHGLAEEIRRARPATVLLSCEQLSARCDAEHIEVLKHFLSPLNAEVRVVVYLRRQDDFLMSSYSTSVKGRRGDRLGTRSAIRNTKRYNYLELLDRWSAAFPNPIVRVLEPEQLAQCWRD